MANGRVKSVFMKKNFLVFIWLLISISPAVSQLNETSFDFWVGHWDLEWKDTSGKVLKGTNRIEKTLDGKVIQEFFEDQQGFKGTSISVYNPKTKTWHQAWADNQGAYFDFIGDVIDDMPVFKTKPIEKDGQISFSRMVFKHISDDSFIWDWESTKDGGKTWQLNWQINYQRQAKK